VAVYKVIQDIEAEDKLLGPLTLKGFIYALIAGTMVFVSVRLAMAGSLGSFRWGIIILLLPPIILFGVLAAPIGKEQPTEVWLLSHVQFLLKPHKKIWSQSGIIETVTITAPKVVEKPRTKDISQVEAKSRLQALATTLDSRGWALQNPDINIATPDYIQRVENSSDRLVLASSMPQNAPVIDIHPGDDILDEGSNAKAKHFKEMVQKADRDRKEELLKNLNSAKKQGFVNSEQKTTHKRAQAKTDSMTPMAEADKIELAKSRNAFSVASLQILANRHMPTIEQVSPNEVIINLH